MCLMEKDIYVENKSTSNMVYKVIVKQELFPLCKDIEASINRENLELSELTYLYKVIFKHPNIDSMKKLIHLKTLFCKFRYCRITTKHLVVMSDILKCAKIVYDDMGKFALEDISGWLKHSRSEFDIMFTLSLSDFYLELRLSRIYNLGVISRSLVTQYCRYSKVVKFITKIFNGKFHTQKERSNSMNKDFLLAKDSCTNKAYEALVEIILAGKLNYCEHSNLSHIVKNLKALDSFNKKLLQYVIRTEFKGNAIAMFRNMDKSNLSLTEKYFLLLWINHGLRYHLSTSAVFKKNVLVTICEVQKLMKNISIRERQEIFSLVDSTLTEYKYNKLLSANRSIRISLMKR